MYKDIVYIHIYMNSGPIQAIAVFNNGLIKGYVIFTEQDNKIREYYQLLRDIMKRVNDQFFKMRSSLVISLFLLAN